MDIPLVSGIKKRAQKPIRIMSAPKNMYVPYPSEVIMYGVVRDMRNDQSH